MRSVCRGLVALCAALLIPLASAADRIRILVQSSPLAGSQYYALAKVAPQLKVGDELVLRRESDNRHDINAVMVLWRDQQLGYLPRKENQAVASAMDRGESLRATVSRINAETSNPWQRLEVAVHVEF